LDDIAPIVIPETPPWLNRKPIFNFELTQYKTSEANPLLIQQHFSEIRSVTSEYSAICTDGSKDGDRVASEPVFGHQVCSARVLSASSIFRAEANAILLALKFVASSVESKFMICSDSLSCLLAIESCKTQNLSKLKFVEIYKSLVAIGKHVIFTWIPNHIGIRPECIQCNSNYSLKHVLIDCINVANVRQTFYNVNNV